MKQKTVTKILFAIYCAVMLWLLFGQRLTWTNDLPYLSQLSENLNLVPFRTILRYINGMSNNDYLFECIKNLAGNIVLFIPLGMIPQIWKKQQYFPRYILTVAVIIVCVEMAQLFTLLGSFDIDDLILNLSGAATGFLLDRKRHI